jgi:hypothetical protein
MSNIFATLYNSSSEEEVEEGEIVEFAKYSVHPVVPYPVVPYPVLYPKEKKWKRNGMNVKVKEAKKVDCPTHSTFNEEELKESLNFLLDYCAKYKCIKWEDI